jgi:hypothetical protein
MRGSGRACTDARLLAVFFVAMRSFREFSQFRLAVVVICGDYS